MGTLAPVSGIRGRAVEISVLGEALDRVASGRHSVVLIEGEAGIGKTRLLGGHPPSGGCRACRRCTGISTAPVT